MIPATLVCCCFSAIRHPTRTCPPHGFLDVEAAAPHVPPAIDTIEEF
ncbi:hypothetical protein GbCGDNIH6_8216 [Granulibacter bethesdensis]|nr:hypothetical protein GbCGDNIH6_8216 [Granulibacter bethesdensis]